MTACDEMFVKLKCIVTILPSVAISIIAYMPLMYIMFSGNLMEFVAFQYLLLNFALRGFYVAFIVYIFYARLTI